MMNFNDIFEILRNRVWNHLTETEIVDMIAESYINGDIDSEEKEILLDLI